MTELQKLQKEYNEIYERMGYLRGRAQIEACNNLLDRIVEKMNKILEKKSNK